MSTIGKRLLLIDDDEQLVAVLVMKLERLGYSIEGITQPEEGYERALSGGYDIIILDMSMPGKNGLDICRDLRASGVITPILILSGITDTHLVVRGLNVGADDYLTKPFHTTELAARIRALLRRNQKAFTTHQVERAGLVLDVPLYTLWLGQRSVVLTQKETLLLKRLMAEAPKPVSRSALLQDVWDIGDANASNRLDVYVGRLRYKLGRLGAGHIRTVRGVGYCLDKT